MSGWGFHWTPCKGSGGGGAWKIALMVAAAALLAAPAEAAVTTAAHVVAEVVRVTIIVLASMLGVAMLAGVGVGVRRAVRWQAARRAVVSRPAPAVAAPSWPGRPALGIPAPRALPAGRPMVPGVVVTRDDGEKVKR